MNNISEQTRLPSLTEFKVIIGDFQTAVKKAPRADINIFGLGDVIDLANLRSVTEMAMSSCLFVKDSGNESELV